MNKDKNIYFFFKEGQKIYIWNVFVCLRNLGLQCSRLHEERKHGFQRKRKKLLNISKTRNSSLKVVRIIPTSNAMMHINYCLLQLLAFAQSQWEVWGFFYSSMQYRGYCNCSACGTLKCFRIFWEYLPLINIKI